MDAYTRRTREWLDAIYEGPPGVPYAPHSPVHGFEAQSRYLGTYSHLFAVLSELGRYEFASCLEVGSGEGFLSAKVRQLFRVPVAGVDLSHRVCRRAAEFFQLPTAVAEARQLPLRDKSVDVVVSINTLEHIADIASAWAELRRVARVAVIVGLPHARQAGERESDAEPHAHVSMLTQTEMRQLFGSDVRVRGSVSRLARPLYALAAQDDVSTRPSYGFLQRPWLKPLHSLARAVAARRDPRATVAWLCRLEDRLSRLWPQQAYESIVVDEVAGARRRAVPLPAEAILAELLR